MSWLMQRYSAFYKFGFRWKWPQKCSCCAGLKSERKAKSQTKVKMNRKYLYLHRTCSNCFLHSSINCFPPRTKTIGNDRVLHCPWPLILFNCELFISCVRCPTANLFKFFHETSCNVRNVNHLHLEFCKLEENQLLSANILWTRAADFSVRLNK